MLKRYQVLLSDWQAEYAKFVAERYDMSFSEVLRMCLSVFAIEAVGLLHPTYKSKFDTRKFVAAAKGLKKESLDAAKMHTYLSQLYFEGRKAVEYRIEHADKKSRASR